MTAADRNKILGTVFIVFGIINILLLIPATIQVLRIVGETQKAAQAAGGVDAPQLENQLGLLFIIAVAVGSFIVVAAVLEIGAGYGMVKQKPWAYTAALIAAVASIISLISFPIGTILGIYTLWFLASKSGKEFYGQLLMTASRK
jgi:magnesium-transporting ATPase (P-type)